MRIRVSAGEVVGRARRVPPPVLREVRRAAGADPGASGVVVFRPRGVVELGGDFGKGFRDRVSVVWRLFEQGYAVEGLDEETTAFVVGAKDGKVTVREGCAPRFAVKFLRDAFGRPGMEGAEARGVLRGGYVRLVVTGAAAGPGQEVEHAWATGQDVLAWQSADAGRRCGWRVWLIAGCAFLVGGTGVVGVAWREHAIGARLSVWLGDGVWHVSDESVSLLESFGEDAVAAGVLSRWHTVRVEKVSGPWVWVWEGERWGWLPLESLSRGDGERARRHFCQERAGVRPVSGEIVGASRRGGPHGFFVENTSSRDLVVALEDSNDGALLEVFVEHGDGVQLRNVLPSGRYLLEVREGGVYSRACRDFVGPVRVWRHPDPIEYRMRRTGGGVLVGRGGVTVEEGSDGELSLAVDADSAEIETPSVPWSWKGSAGVAGDVAGRIWRWCVDGWTRWLGGGGTTGGPGRRDR